MPEFGIALSRSEAWKKVIFESHFDFRPEVK